MHVKAKTKENFFIFFKDKEQLETEKEVVVDCIVAKNIIIIISAVCIYYLK